MVDPSDGRSTSNSHGTDPETVVSRRGVLGTQALLLAGVGSAGESTGKSSFSATVDLEDGARGGKDVPETLFGRFAEHYGAHEAYPGLYAEHVTNTSFVEWVQFQGNVSHMYGFDEIGTYDGVPFPWEPISEESADGVEFERPDQGGIRGYDEWELDENHYPVPAEEPGNAYQRVFLDGSEGGVAQRIALPDWRTLTYELAVSVRAEGIDTLEVRLVTPDDRELLASETIPDLPEEWERYEDLDLELSERSGSVLQGGANDDFASPYGEYILEFVAEGEGHVDLDWVSLVPGDALEGERTGAPFNRTSIELMQDRNAALLKWPGGNYTSTYPWENGIGPEEERPIWPNIIWDGLDENVMGTAEYVDFCELAGAEPTITVGVTVPPEEGGRGWQPPEPITPEDAANWVEYCNGSTDTEYGALRAEHGYEEPFDIEVWEVGNEVWGPWQAGGTDDPQAFAERAAEFAEAMLAVDDSITVVPDGMDPKYDDPNLVPDPESWNEALFETVGDELDSVGMHRYNWGIRDLEMLADWKEENDADAIDYNEVLVMFPTQFDELIVETIEAAAEFGLDDLQFMIGEWGLYPTVEPGDPWPGMPSMAGAAYAAGMFNAFIRRSDHLRRASHTHVPVRMFPPESVDHPANPNPLLSFGYTQALYANVFDTNQPWDVIDATVGGEKRDIPETGFRIRAMEDVPYVDAAAVATRDRGTVCTFLTNRNLRNDAHVTVEVPDGFEDADVSVIVQRPTDGPHALQNGLGDYPESWYEWTGLEVYDIDEREPSLEEGTLILDLEPSAVARLVLATKPGEGQSDDTPGDGPPEDTPGERPPEDTPGDGPPEDAPEQGSPCD